MATRVERPRRLFTANEYERMVESGVFRPVERLELIRGEIVELTDQEAQTIEAFLLLDRWRSLIDLSIVMRVDADIAMKREVGQRITKQVGSIMNPDVLTAITRSVDTAVDRHGAKP